MSFISRANSPFLIADVQRSSNSESQTKNQNQNIFYTGIVREFYADPAIMTDSELNLIRSLATNGGYVDKMPVNSLWCNFRDGSSAIAYPFFSPHMTPPIKPGEQVWLILDGDLYYWLTRKVFDYTIDDINYTHGERVVINSSTENSTSRSAKDVYNGTTGQTEGIFPNGKTDKDVDTALGAGRTYQDIINSSYSYRASFEPEAVPRITKNPGDLLLQGSNNSSIVVGSDFIVDRKNAGIVDIVAGHAIKTDHVSPVNQRGYQEINKKKPASQDAPKSFSNDASRIYLASQTNVDNIFGVSINGFEVSNSAAGIVLKSDQVRIIARQDIKITVGNTGAGIVLKSDGNIVIVPSDSGVIKLGGEDANKAILCQDATEAIPGNVTAPPVISTAGGIIGSSAISGTGLFASKILVK